MPDEKEPKELSPGAKYALIGTLATALIGLIGTALTLYFQNVAPINITLHATQTVEARQTLAALSVMPTLMPTFSSTPFQATSTANPLPTPPLGQPSGLRFCVNAFESIGVWVRSGPGITYAAAGTLNNGACPYFDATNEDDTWARISPNQEIDPAIWGGWVRKDLLGLFGPVNLPQITSTPTPTDTPAPTATPTPLG